ncbi:DUF3164 family protein [Ancylobacter dichloromethanicus]
MNEHSEAAPAEPAAALPPGAFFVRGKPVMTNAKGDHVPLSRVTPADLLIDETVRKMMGFAIELNAQIARFRGHCFDDVGGAAGTACSGVWRQRRRQKGEYHPPDLRRDHESHHSGR